MLPQQKKTTRMMPHPLVRKKMTICKRKVPSKKIMVYIRIQEQYEMDIAFDMIDESDGGDTDKDYEGDFTEISITLSDYSPTRGRNGFQIDYLNI